MMFEILFAIVVVVVIAIMTTGSLVAGVFGPGLIDAIRFPVVIPLWEGARMTKPPPNVTAADVSRMFFAVTQLAEYADVSEEAVAEALSGARIRWIPATPGGSPGGTERGIVDPWGRLIDGEPMWVGGYFSQGVCFVVYLDGDRVEDTQLHHELAHAILSKEKGGDDASHAHPLFDEVQWNARTVYKSL